MSKRKSKKIKKVVKFLLLLIIILGCYLIGYPIFKDKTNINNLKEKVKEVVKEEPKDSIYTAKLIAGGDALIHNAVRYSAQKKDGSWDFNPQFDMIKDIINEYDIKFYNQESIIDGTDLFPERTGLFFNTPNSYGEAAINAGFNLISLANNHSMDSGKSGALGTSEYWKKMQENHNIIYDGITDSEEMRNNYDRLIGEANGIKYGFLAYTTSTNGNPVPKNMPYLVNVYSEDKVKKDIQELKNKDVDVIIVSMHWGIEYILEPNKDELKIANFLNSQDVDIIIGNHAHCIQPIDIITNETTGKKTTVFYALGNLMSNQGLLVNKSSSYGQKVIIGALGTLNITKTVSPDGTKKVEINDVGAELTYTYSTTPGSTLSTTREYKIIPFSKMEDKYLTITTSEYKNNLQKLYDDYSKVLTKYNDNIKVVPLQSKLNNQ